MNMKKYELSYLISSELEEESVKAFSEKITALIKEKGGVLDLNQTSPIKKRLIQPIKKNTAAYVQTFNFNLEPEKLNSLKKTLENNPDILRILLVKKEMKKEKPIKRRKIKEIAQAPILERKEKAEEKVELEKIDKKLEEILGEM